MRRKLRNKVRYFKNERGCYVCTSHPLDEDGYPIVYIPPNTTIRLHRLIYMKYHGPVPEGMIVRHKCDNRLCVNPEHLELGTKNDNVQDAVARNRQAKGNKIWSSKLTEKEVQEIIKDDKHSYGELARRYGVSKTTIFYIKHGKTWKHIRKS
jgi:hypothetical protein